MAIATGTAIAASSVIGAGAAIYSANRQSRAVRNASNDAINEQRRAEDVARGDLEPYRTGGQAGLDNITGAAQGDFSNFFASPGYEFVRNEGIRDIENTFSARGSGGNALRALTQYSSGLASNEYGNWYDRNFNLAALGSNAAAGQATATRQSANNIGNSAMARGQQMAGIYDARTSGVMNSLNSGLSNYLYARGTQGNNEIEEIPLWSLPRRR